MNDQRMVDVGLLRRAVALLSTVYPAVVADKLRAIIDGPGVEPVAEPIAYAIVVNGKLMGFLPYKENDDCVPVYLAAPSAPVQMKDHEKRELVNELTAIAKQYGQTQQLRDRIAHCIIPALSVPAPVQAVTDLRQVLGDLLEALNHRMSNPDAVYRAERAARKAYLSAAPQPSKEQS